MKTWCDSGAPAAAVARRVGSRRAPGRALPFVLGLVLLASSLLAQTPSDPVAERQRQLQVLKSEIEANRKEIERLKSKEKDIARLSERITKDRNLTRRYLRELQAQDDDLRSDLASRQVDLLDKEVAARQAADRLKRGIVKYYRMRHVAGPELLFSSRTFSELFARSQFLARLVYRERVELIALADERQRIAEAAEALEQRRRGLEQLQTEKQRQVDYLLRQGKAAQEELSEVRDERAERERRVKELEESEAAIRQMLARLERERAAMRARGELPPAGDPSRMRGRIPWPADGAVIGEFGVEVNPRYGTKVPSNGIDIAAPSGAPIRAVQGGLVEFVDWLPGYGRTVILNHGGGLYTLYAHASAVDVQRGQRVAEGQVIARVGDTDSIKGTCLHFEIRQGERALNPREWLQ